MSLDRGAVAMIRDRTRSACSSVALALVVALAASTIAAVATTSPAEAAGGWCTYSGLSPNSLTLTESYRSGEYWFYLDARVTPALALSSFVVSVEVNQTYGYSPIATGQAGLSGGQYYWTRWFRQSAFGLWNPGDSNAINVLFRIPYQGDRRTCSVQVSYETPPTPIPTPTPMPAPTPAPTPIPPMKVNTITLGQQEILSVTGGVPYAQVLWQASPDLVTWSGLSIVTLDGSGNATYTFAPSQTAYYRAYFYNPGQYGQAMQVIVVQPAPTPLPTRQPDPSPVPTIYTITLGQSVTVSNQGSPGAIIQFESSLDGGVWTSMGRAEIDSSGSASLTFRPATNLFIRTTVAGQSSPLVRGIVRQVAILRPTSSGKTKAVLRGATVTFTTTVRPQAGVPGVARYRVYRWTGTAWALFNQGLRSTDAAGIARLVWKFTTRGQFYVRVMADSTTYNANSAWSQVERYDVR